MVARKTYEFIRKNSFLKSLIKGAYLVLMFPFTRRGVEVNIGGAGRCRLDYMFALRGYDNFGDRHNAGFKKWIDCCKDKKTVFDIGAHIGLYTIPASKVVAPGGKVYAFEPSGANRKYLMRHFEYNDINNAVIAPYLVGDVSKKEQMFYESKRTDPMNSLHPKKNAWLYKKVLREQIALDDFVRWNDIGPQVIKIDVEGAEYNVLKGAREVLKKYLPVIFLSIHPRQLSLFGASIEKLQEIILQTGYCIRDNNGAEADCLEFGEYVLLPRGRPDIWQ